MFSDKTEKDQLWTKLSMKIIDDIVKRRSSIVITHVRVTLTFLIFINLPQDCSEKRKSLIESKAWPVEKTRRTAVVKPLTSTKGRIKNKRFQFPQIRYFSN